MEKTPPRSTRGRNPNKVGERLKNSGKIQRPVAVGKDWHRCKGGLGPHLDRRGFRGYRPRGPRGGTGNENGQSDLFQNFVKIIKNLGTASDAVLGGPGGDPRPVGTPGSRIRHPAPELLTKNTITLKWKKLLYTYHHSN